MSDQPRKPVPPSLTALGKRPIPTTVDADGRTYRWVRTFKNDFFAATALYECNGQRVIIKFGRRAGFLLIPLRWVGRILTAREQSAMRRLADLEGIPRFLARVDASTFVREYIEGHAMCKGERVPDDFHQRLRDLVAEVHRRGMAYVDLEKCENVIVGDDGHPYLCDFQIAWYVPQRWGGEWPPMAWIRAWLQRGDRYHLVKLQRRTRADQLSTAELADSYRKPLFVRTYGVLTRPWTKLRRAILQRVDPRRKQGERGRVVDEDVDALAPTEPLAQTTEVR